MSMPHLKIVLALQRGQPEELRITRSSGPLVEAFCSCFSGLKRGSGLWCDGENSWRARSRQTVQVLTCALLKHAPAQVEIRLLAKSW